MKVSIGAWSGRRQGVGTITVTYDILRMVDRLYITLQYNEILV